MKNFAQVLTLFIFVVSATVNSQNPRPISELLDELSKNHMGSVTEVFSLEEIRIIKEHFTETTFPTNSESTLANGRYASTQSVSTIDACDIDRDNLGTVEILRNSPITAFPGAGVFVRGTSGPIGGPPRIFVVDNDGHLWVRDPGESPVSITDMGELTGIPAGYSITGMEVITGADAAIFGTSTNGTNSILVRIAPDDLTVTPVGGTNGLVLPIGLAKDENETLYTIDIDNDMVYTLDKTNGTATQIGGLGYNADFGQAFFYDEETSQLLSLAYNSTIGDSELRTVNPLTGFSTNLGTIQPGTVQQFGWGSYYDRDLLNTVESEIDGFNFFPNPAQNIITLNTTNAINTIEIYSVLGTLVKSRTVARRNLQIDISELPSGSYILRVTTAKQSGIYKFIKK